MIPHCWTEKSLWWNGRGVLSTVDEAMNFEDLRADLDHLVAEIATSTHQKNCIQRLHILHKLDDLASLALGVSEGSSDETELRIGIEDVIGRIESMMAATEQLEFIREAGYQ